MDLVNAPGGYLSVEQLLTAATYSPVPPALHYRLESALRGAKPFWATLAAATGYPVAPDSGVTVAALFDNQILWVTEANGLPRGAKGGVAVVGRDGVRRSTARVLHRVTVCVPLRRATVCMLPCRAARML